MGGTDFVFIYIGEREDRIGYLNEVALPKLGDLSNNARVECSADRFDIAMTQILDGLEEARGHDWWTTIAGSLSERELEGELGVSKSQIGDLCD